MLNHTGTQIIETERLILRPFYQNDAQAMIKNWCADPEVAYFVGWNPHESIGVTYNVLAIWDEQYKKPDFYNWAIILRESGEPVGSIGTVGVNEKNLSCEIGYCISRPLWGKGLMSEALSAALDFLFGRVRFNRIYARHDTNNPASGRVMEKCGMKLEGVQRQAGYKHNRGFYDLAVRSILKSEYFDNANTGNYVIIPLIPDNFDKCAGIWDMKINPDRTKKRYDALISGKAETFVCVCGDKYIGEYSFYRSDDEDYYIEGKRAYLSHMVVAPELRGTGIGRMLCVHAVRTARERGFSELSVGVDTVNRTARRLYENAGFTDVIFSGADENGEYYKLLKRFDARDADIYYSSRLDAKRFGELREAVGWKFIGKSFLQKGADNSDFLVTAQKDGAVVGMARALCDGGYQSFIVDVIVLPELQGHGIGRGLMERLMKRLRETTPAGCSRMVNLMAAKGKEGFYEKFGFYKRPDENLGAGMNLWIDGSN